MLTAANQFRWAGAGTRQWAKLCYRRAVPGDDDVLTPLDTAQDLPSPVPQFTHRYRIHVRKRITGETTLPEE